MHIVKPLLAITTALSISVPTFAERDSTRQTLVESSTFTATTLAGTALGGPLGMVIGASAGAFLAHETRKANEYAGGVNHMANTVQTAEALAMQQRQEIEQLQAELSEALALQVLFATGSDDLSDLNKNKLAKLVEQIDKHQELEVRLTGHTDVRGSDEYNNVLAIERARSVQRELIELGVAAHRIHTAGFGSQYATAGADDANGLARDRRVEVVLSMANKPLENLAGK